MSLIKNSFSFWHWNIWRPFSFICLKTWSFISFFSFISFISCFIRKLSGPTYTLQVALFLPPSRRSCVSHRAPPCTICRAACPWSRPTCTDSPAPRCWRWAPSFGGGRCRSLSEKMDRKKKHHLQFRAFSGFCGTRKSSSHRDTFVSFAISSLEPKQDVKTSQLSDWSETSPSGLKVDVVIKSSAPSCGCIGR